MAWKVKDADRLLDDALKIPADRHSIAATALRIVLETPGPKARELAALYSQYGQPAALRTEAVGALARLAKDDEALEDILVALVDDPDRFVRFRSWGAIRELKLKKASGALKARLGQEATGFNGFGQRMLEETLEALGEKEPAAASTAPAPNRPRSPTSTARPPTWKTRPATSAQDQCAQERRTTSRRSQDLGIIGFALVGSWMLTLWTTRARRPVQVSLDQHKAGLSSLQGRRPVWPAPS